MATVKPLNGKRFVITGALSLPRLEAAKMIKSYGGRVTSVISGKTDYLVVGESEKPGEKVATAKEMGVKRIREARLVRMMLK